MKKQRYELKLTELQKFVVEPLDGKHDAALVALSNTTQILKNLKIDHWLSSGTLLGIHRDRKFITGDRDIDLAVNWDQAKGKTGMLTREMFRKGLRLAHVAMLNEDHIVRLMYYDNQNRILVDLSFYFENAGMMQTVKKAGLIAQPKNQIYPIATKQYKKIKFSCPANVEVFLETRFGKNWKTPSNDGVHYDINKNLRGVS